MPILINIILMDINYVTFGHNDCMTYLSLGFVL